MSTTTPNLTLTLYDSTTDQVVTFATFRAVWGGTATTSNFYRIDTWAGTVNSAITTLQNQRGAIPVSASYISANYYESTVSSISSYVTGMTILLKLDTDSAGTVTLNINALGTKSVTKVNSSGTIVNMAGAELQSNRYYMFTYDGTQWVWVNADSADQVYHGGTSGNIVLVASDGSISDSSAPATVVGSAVYNATGKTTLANADTIGITDSAASNVLKKITWSNFQTAIGTVFGAIVNALTAKTTPVGADEIVIGDSASSNASKKVLLSNLYKALGTGTQDSTTYLRGDGTYSVISSGGGWQDGTGTWSYTSADSPNFVMSVPDADAAEMNVGTRIKLTQTTVKYFGVQSIGTPSGGFTPVTIFGGTDYTLANAAITSPSWSNEKSPIGFPMSPLKWEVRASSTELKSKSSPTINTWYGGASAFTSGSAQSIDIPIGGWKVTKKCVSQCTTNSSATDADIFSTLSSSNNSESDTEFTTYVRNGGASGTLSAFGFSSVTKFLVLTSKTTYYHLIKWSNATSANAIYLRGDIVPTQIILDWAYL